MREPAVTHDIPQRNCPTQLMMKTNFAQIPRPNTVTITAPEDPPPFEIASACAPVI